VQKRTSVLHATGRRQVDKPDALAGRHEDRGKKIRRGKLEYRRYLYAQRTNINHPRTIHPPSNSSLTNGIRYGKMNKVESGRRKNRKNKWKVYIIIANCRRRRKSSNARSKVEDAFNCLLPTPKKLTLSLFPAESTWTLTTPPPLARTAAMMQTFPPQHRYPKINLQSPPPPSTTRSPQNTPKKKKSHLQEAGYAKAILRPHCIIEEKKTKTTR
jgi:hypothetical protein